MGLKWAKKAQKRAKFSKITESKNGQLIAQMPIFILCSF